MPFELANALQTNATAVLLTHASQPLKNETVGQHPNKTHLVNMFCLPCLETLDLFALKYTSDGSDQKKARYDAACTDCCNFSLGNAKTAKGLRNDCERVEMTGNDSDNAHT